MSGIKVPDFDISAEADSVFVGFVLSTCLLGVTIVQAWNYAHNNRDTWKLRAFVMVLVALDVATTICNSIFAHTYLIQHFGNYLELQSVLPSFLAEDLITAIIILLSELFFASRIYLLNPGKYWLPVAIVFTAVLGFGFNMYAFIEQFKYGAVVDISRQQIKISYGFHQAMIIISDGIATVVLCLNFIKARSNSNAKRTNTVLQNLLTFTVSRGLLIAMTDLVLMILYCLHPTNLHWMALHLLMSKLYVVTMVAI